MSHGKLSGRVAIVTGGARGIGLAIVEDLIAHGAAVVIVDSGVSISGEPVEPRLADEVTKKYPDAAAVCADIAEPGTAVEAVELALERFGSVDLVVNNAAILRDSLIFKADPEAFEAVIRTNLTGAYRMLAAVNIVSTAGIYGNFGQSAYGAAKAALIGLTRVAAHDLARAKITCNAVAPFAATRVTENIKPANDAQAAYKEKAMRVPATYVARLVAFLASPAAGAISGQLFGVRGREVFIFSQPRPVSRLLQPAGGYDLDGFAAGIRALEPYYADLITDLEAFSGDPVL